MTDEEMRRLQKIRYHFASRVSNMLDSYMPIDEGAERHIAFVDVLVARIMTCYSDRQWLDSGLEPKEQA